MFLLFVLHSWQMTLIREQQEWGKIGRIFMAILSALKSWSELLASKRK